MAVTGWKVTAIFCRSSGCCADMKCHGSSIKEEALVEAGGFDIEQPLLISRSSLLWPLFVSE